MGVGVGGAVGAGGRTLLAKQHRAEEEGVPTARGEGGLPGTVVGGHGPRAAWGHPGHGGQRGFLGSCWWV